MARWLNTPTWLLYRAFRKHLPEEHPWRNTRFSLTNWAKHSTPLNATFGGMFWFYIVLMMLVLVRTSFA